MRIAILTPTRHRPRRLLEMLDAIARTAAQPATVHVGIDDDDTGYQDEYDCTPHTVIVHRHARQRLGPWVNMMAALERDADILAFFGDDHRPRTVGWDTAVCDAFTGMGSGLVYGCDRLQNERLPTAPFWSTDIIRELGWYYPPNQVHMFADDFWLRLANDLGRCTYLPDVVIEHMHPSARKAQTDDVYQEADTNYGRDGDAFRRLVNSAEYRQLVGRIRRIL